EGAVIVLRDGFTVTSLEPHIDGNLVNLADVQLRAHRVEARVERELGELLDGADEAAVALIIDCAIRSYRADRAPITRHRHRAADATVEYLVDASAILQPVDDGEDLVCRSGRETTTGITQAVA